VPGALEDVAAAAARGDAVAFAEFVRATQVDVWRACAALVDAQSADDLVQETYLRAHRALPRFAGESSVRTWLLSIARHVCLDEIRTRSRQRRLFAGQPPRPLSIEPGASVDLELLIGALAADRREAFVLTQLVGLSYDEAAVVCKCPVGTIRSRVARARAELIASMRAAEAPTV
jgi:RNA polymerase sigma-70 factor (ECF subfamily)